jgi:hypothetical protein
LLTRLARPDPASEGGDVELGPRARVAFTASYLSLQALLIGTAGRRPEHAFGFQMFSESCTARLTLLREIDAPSGHGTVLVPAYHGEWTAEGVDGARHRFEWRDRVQAPLLSTFDVTFEAGYGQSAELARVEAALDDVAAHLEGDAETRRLVVDVTLRRNGHEPTVVRLTSPPRSPKPDRGEPTP